VHYEDTSCAPAGGEDDRELARAATTWPSARPISAPPRGLPTRRANSGPGTEIGYLPAQVPFSTGLREVFTKLGITYRT
jgi:hypothetical protein